MTKSTFLYMELMTKSGRRFHLALDGTATVLADPDGSPYGRGAMKSIATHYITPTDSVVFREWYRKIPQPETILVISNNKLGFMTTRHAVGGVRRFEESFVSFQDTPCKGLIMVNVMENDGLGLLDIFFEEIESGFLI